MINRELIRTKAVQLTYAFFQNNGKSMEEAEKELLHSLNEAYNLYNCLLLLIVNITRVARKRNEMAAQKAEREGMPLPSPRFAENAFATQLESNRALCAFAEERRDIWVDRVDFVKGLFRVIEQSAIYQEYMASDADDYETHREVWRKLYKAFIQSNVDVEATLEEISIYWNDDKAVVDTFVLKTIKRFDPNAATEQELLPEYTSEEDREYARMLFRSAVLNAEQYQRYMQDASRNWDFSRLAYMDIVIMQLAIAEMMTFPAIPINVTISEYVELAKLYSTPRSGSYINGMLDTIARHLVETGRMLKPMPERKKKQTVSQQTNNFK